MGKKYINSYCQTNLECQSKIIRKATPLVEDRNTSQFMYKTRTTVSQDVQTRFSVQLAFAKFLSKIKVNF